MSIQIKRGLSANVGPLTLLAGELAVATDTGAVYIGTGSGKVLINPSMGSAASCNTGTSSGNVPVLDSNGKLATSILPSVTINETYVVASQSAMLALSANVGDIAIRTDLNECFILQTSGANTLANWQQLLSPTGAVTSVAGKTGAVTLTSSDVGLGNVANQSVPTMFTNQAGTLTPVMDGTGTIGTSINFARQDHVHPSDTTKAPVASPTFTGTPSAPTPTTGTNTTQIATTAFVQSAISVIDGGTF